MDKASRHEFDAVLPNAFDEWVKSARSQDDPRTPDDQDAEGGLPAAKWYGEPFPIPTYPPHHPTAGKKSDAWVEYDEANDVDERGEHFRKFKDSDPYYGHMSNASYSRAGEKLTKKGKRSKCTTDRRTHICVALLFGATKRTALPFMPGLECDHMLGDKKNNAVDALQWLTKRQNARKGVHDEKRKKSRKL